MGISQILSTIFAVLLNPAVIFATVVVIFYLSFVNFVVRYRKRPPRVKKKKMVVATPVAESAEEGSEAE